jgi:hypothetical protein
VSTPNSTTCRPLTGRDISELLAPFGSHFIATYPDYMEIRCESMWELMRSLLLHRRVPVKHASLGLW